jgi:hypothetical protein
MVSTDTPISAAIAATVVDVNPSRRNSRRAVPMIA